MPTVNSSLLYSMDYDEGEQKLTVMFRTTGGVYEYSNVPLTVYEALLDSVSIGSAFDRMVKKGGYSWRHVA